MQRRLRLLFKPVALVGLLVVGGLIPALDAAFAQSAGPVSSRIALVIGNAAYRAGSLETPANDAGLLAETLRQAGYDVVGARDLDQDSIRRAFRDFLDKAQSAGPQATAVVYLSGYGLQYAGENYYVPVEATLARDSAIPIETVRLSDFTRALAATPLKARVEVFDLARANPYARQDQPLAGGLALMDPEPETLYAFNAAPGTVGPNEPGPYGAYATALNEMMREGLPVNDIFTQTRLRVNELTKGLEVPWDASAIHTPFNFFERAPDAPPLAALNSTRRADISRPLQGFSPEDAYGIAVERDTLRGYQEFLNAFPNHPLARRVRALLAARREAITWDKTWHANTPDAYWSYLERYPHGPHARDADRRLAFLSQPIEPPAHFTVYDYADLPPPPPDEVVFVDRRPYVEFDVDDYAPPPPPPVFLIDRPRREFVDLPPPPWPQGLGFLPIPVPVPLPWSRPVGGGFGGGGNGASHGGPPPGQIQHFVAPSGGAPGGTGGQPNGQPQPFQGGPRVGQTHPFGQGQGQGRGEQGQGGPATPPVQVPVVQTPPAQTPPGQAPLTQAPVTQAPASGVTSPQHTLPLPPTPQPGSPQGAGRPLPGSGAPQGGLSGGPAGGLRPGSQQTAPLAAPLAAPVGGPRPGVPAAPVAQPKPVTQPRPAAAVPAAPTGPSPADLARQRQQQLQLQQQQLQQQRAAQQAAQQQRAAQAAQQRAAQQQQQAAQRAQQQAAQQRAAQQQQQAQQRAAQAQAQAQQRAAQAQAQAQAQQRTAQQAAQQRAQQQQQQARKPACGHPNEPPCPH